MILAATESGSPRSLMVGAAVVVVLIWLIRRLK